MTLPMDRQRLIDMRDNARRAVTFLGEADAAALEADELRLFAVLHAIQVVGEAAAKVSDTSRLQNPGVAWSQATRMRHLLVHNYNEIKVDIVVQTVRDDLPGLIAELETILEGDS